MNKTSNNIDLRVQLKKLLPENKVDDLMSIGKMRMINANEYYISAGEVPTKIAFVCSGLFRYVYFKKNGDEYTKGILTECNFLSSYSAMILKKNSYFFIEALENSQIFEINWEIFNELMQKDIFWVGFLLKFVEKGFIIKEKRERDLLLLDAETRYNNFLIEFPCMDQRIKQGIIASYLGIKPETLSRIRKRSTF
jgi:CRP-like cAMP-binding protein